MKNIRDKILAFMRDSSYAPMTSEELLDALAGECSATKFWQELLALEQNGEIIKTRFETYGLPEKMGLVAGRFQLTSKGFGFVIPDNINFSNIADTLKDTSKTESTEPKAKPSASKTPIPQNKKQETAFSDLNGIFNNIGIKDNNRPSSPSQKPKIDSTCKPNFL